MNKTAVLISGQARSFSHCIASQYFHVYRHLKDPVFFVSVADDENASSMYLLEERFPGKVHVEFVKQPEVPEPNKHHTAHSPYSLSVPIQSVMKQLWGYKRVWEFFQEKKGEGEFSTFIRIRPDLFFSSCEEHVKVPRTAFFGLWKSKCGGVNDRFSIMGAEAAKAYFGALDALPGLLAAGCPLHPESIQKAALEAAGCPQFNILTAEFTTIRIDGRPNQQTLEYPGEAQQFASALRCVN